MAIEITDIAKVTGIELTTEDTQETFIEKFNAAYVPAEQHGKKLKEVEARATHAITKSFRDVGFEIDKEELNGKSLFELPSVYASKIKSTVDELNSNKSATEEEIAKKYQSEIEKYKSKATDLSGLLEGTKTEFETFKTEIVQKEKKRTVDGYFGNAMGSLNWSESAIDIVKKGFRAEVMEKYRFDLDDENNPVVRDIEGNVVRSKAKAGEAATYDEIISLEFSKIPEFQQKVNPKKVTTFGGGALVMPTESNNGRKLATPHTK
jgi:hypothetical protein